jgi:hypothetical protein
MRKRIGLLAIAISSMAVSAALRADDLTGQDQILCTSVQVTICSSDGQCKIESPWSLNIPQFVQIDLKEKTVSTTPASGENRSSPIRTLLREAGEIYLQGVEGGRAFSFVIEEETGMASIAVAREGKTVSIFGACTPMPASK